MEGGLGSTRMGSRSSTRHGPASVFQGRVRRWRKSWAPVAPSTTPSAASCRVLLYKWTPLAVPSNGTKESTPEESPPAKPLRFLPVSVVLHQRKEEAQKAAEEAEALARLEKESEAATNPTAETNGAEAKDSQEDTNMSGAQTEEIGVNVTESEDPGVEGDAQATRTELPASLQDQDESIAAPQEPEAASLDMDQSK